MNRKLHGFLLIALAISPAICFGDMGHWDRMLTRATELINADETVSRPIETSDQMRI